MQQENNALVSVKEVADRFQLSRQQVRRLAYEAGLPAVQITSRILRFDMDAVDRWLRENPTVERATRLAGLRPDEAKDLINAGILPCVTVAGRRFVPSKDLNEWIGYLERCTLWASTSARTGKRTDGFVYFVEADGTGLIKIGWSAKLDASRLAEIDAGSPVPVKLLAVKPGGMKEEQILHRRFYLGRRRREWFDKRTPGLAAEIAACRREYGKPRGLKLPKNPWPSGVSVASEEN